MRGTPSEPESDGSEMILLPKSAPAPVVAPPDIHIHPSNWLAFELFEFCATQWRLQSSFSGSRRTGMDYTAVKAVMDAWGAKKQRKLLKQIRLLEIGALSVINEQQDLSDNAADSG